MSLIFQTIIIGLLVLISKIFSDSYGPWIVWYGFAIWSILLFLKGLDDRRALKKGKTLKDITGAEVLPYSMLAVFIVLYVFYINGDLNKFHLLWIVNVVTFIVEGIIFKINSKK